MRPFKDTYKIGIVYVRLLGTLEYAFWALNEARELASTTPGGHYRSQQWYEQEINGRSTQAKVVKKVVLHHLDSTGRAAREKRGSISYSGHDSMGLLKIYHYLF